MGLAGSEGEQSHPKRAKTPQTERVAAASASGDSSMNGAGNVSTSPTCPPGWHCQSVDDTTLVHSSTSLLSGRTAVKSGVSCSQTVSK